MSTRHYEESACIPATARAVFDFVDDPTRLSSHMSRSSWMMGGGNMAIVLDEGRGQAVGSHIRLSGKAFGFSLFADEVVTRREPPRLKVWETVGLPTLLVIGTYRMTTMIEPQLEGSTHRSAMARHAERRTARRESRARRLRPDPGADAGSLGGGRPLRYSRYRPRHRRERAAGAPREFPSGGHIWLGHADAGNR